MAVSVSVLRSQLEDERSTLSRIDASIRRLVQPHNRLARFGPSAEFNRNTNDKKRETKTVFSRLRARSGSEEGVVEEKRARVSSCVSRELPSRADVLKVQTGDEAARSRNRRMFGSLLGTLHKFKQEEIVLQNKEEKKAQVEKKIEEQARQEREREIQERKTLFAEREHKKATIKALEVKMSRLSEFEKWETTQKYLENFILTETKPQIYWLPKNMNQATSDKLEVSRTLLQKSVCDKRARLQEDLERIQRKCGPDTSPHHEPPAEESSEQAVSVSEADRSPAPAVSPSARSPTPASPT